MRDGTPSASTPGKGGADVEPRPDPDAPEPASDVEDVAGETVGDVTGLPDQDPDLGFVQDAGFGDDPDEGEAEGTDGFEDYDQSLEAGDVPDDERFAREVDAAADPEGDTTEKGQGDAAEPAEGAEEEAEEGDEGGAEAASEEAPPEKFSFAGEEFDSKEAAEQNLRSLRGQFKSKNDEIQELRTANNSYELQFQKMQTEMAKGTGPQDGPQAEAEPKPGEQKPEFNGADATEEIITKKLNWEQIKKLRETEGEDAALAWALYQFGGELTQKFQEQLQTETAGYKQVQEQAHERQMAIETFSNARKMLDKDGATPLYPEFGDSEATAEIVDIWKRLGLPPETAYSPTGVFLAVASHRYLKGMAADGGKTPAPAPTAPGAEGVTDPVVAAVERAAAANGDVVPSSERGPRGGKRRVDPRKAAAQAIKDAGTGNDPELGFTF
jgi:hypothetical protein